MCKYDFCPCCFPYRKTTHRSSNFVSWLWIFWSNKNVFCPKKVCVLNWGQVIKRNVVYDIWRETCCLSNWSLQHSLSFSMQYQRYHNHKTPQWTPESHKRRHESEWCWINDNICCDIASVVCVNIRLGLGWVKLHFKQRYKKKVWIKCHEIKNREKKRTVSSFHRLR